MSVFLWWGALALAQEEGIASWGDVRTLGSVLTDFPVDAAGDSHGQAAWLDQRVRLGVGLNGPVGRLVTEWDILTGQLAGDTWTIDRDIDARDRGERDALSLSGVTPRQLFAETVVGNVQLQAGLVTSHWGLGMLANDGAHDPLFGRTDLGDRVVRLRATRLPPPDAFPRRSLLLTGALDYVVEDDAVALSDEQSAVQGIVSLVWVGRRISSRVEPERFGVYGVVRNQWEHPVWQTGTDDPRSTQAFVLDGFFDRPWSLSGGWLLRSSVEVAVVGGRTDRAVSYTARDSLGVLSLGAAGHAVLTEPAGVAKVHLRAGYASGDADPDDPVSHDFTFDRNFGAGMVLFDQVLGAVDAAAHGLLTDPAIAGQAPDGIDALVNEGALRRAAFVQPAIEASPLPWADVRVGVVMAFATVPYAQPFYSFRAGGTPTNQHDLPAQGRLLGTELDWALGVRRSDEDDTWWRPSLEVQGGHLALGSPLQGVGPNTVHHVMGVARLQW